MKPNFLIFGGQITNISEVLAVRQLKKENATLTGNLSDRSLYLLIEVTLSKNVSASQNKIYEWSECSKPWEDDNKCLNTCDDCIACSHFYSRFEQIQELLGIQKCNDDYMSTPIKINEVEGWFDCLVDCK